MPRTPDDAVPYIASVGKRAPAARLGVAVVSALVEAIVQGEIAPGGLLPPEQALSRQFGVSRTVIRESVKRVEEKGLLTVAQGRGTEVAPMASWNILDPMVLDALIASEKSLDVLDDLTAVRLGLEGMLAADAATVITDETAALIRQAWADLESCLGDAQAFHEAERRFHAVVTSLSGNRIADGIAQTLAGRVTVAAPAPPGEDGRQATLSEHRALVESVCSGDAPAAERAMRVHIAQAWQRRRAALGA